MEAVPVESIVWTPVGYRAAGGDGLRLAVWASDDGATWELLTTLSRACCERYEQAASLSRWGDRLVLSTRGEVREGGAGGPLVPAAFVRVSEDDGETWDEVTGGPVGMPGMSIDDLAVAGEVLLVTGRVEDADHEVTSSLWRTTDLSTWDELELRGAPAVGFRSVVSTPSGVLLARTFSDDGTQTWYRSTDDGRSFERADGPDLPTSSWQFATVGNQLVLAVESDHGDAVYPPEEVQRGPVLVSTTDGESWSSIERNTGFWGDGAPDPGVALTVDDAAWFVLSRTMREQDGYCFDDVVTCEAHEAVIGHVDDDFVFRTVAIDLDPERYFLVAGDDGSLLLWSERRGSESEDHRSYFETLRWAGPDPPPLDPEPSPLAPPSDGSAVLRFDVSSVEVGDTFRIRLALGGCGGGVLEGDDDRQYLLEDAPSEPYPESWPFKEETADDAAHGYLFVEGSHPDADTFEFAVDDSTTLAYRYDPDPDEGPSCG